MHFDSADRRDSYSETAGGIDTIDAEGSEIEFDGSNNEDRIRRQALIFGVKEIELSPGKVIALILGSLYISTVFLPVDMSKLFVNIIKNYFNKGGDEE